MKNTGGTRNSAAISAIWRKRLLLGVTCFTSLTAIEFGTLALREFQSTERHEHDSARTLSLSVEALAEFGDRDFTPLAQRFLDRGDIDSIRIDIPKLGVSQFFKNPGSSDGRSVDQWGTRTAIQTRDGAGTVTVVSRRRDRAWTSEIAALTVVELLLINILLSTGIVAANDLLQRQKSRIRVDRTKAAAAATKASSTGECAVFIIDIDRLSHINGLYGENVGNMVIQTVHDRIFKNLINAEHDSIHRIGGDEFAVIVHGALDETWNAAEQIFGSLGEDVEIDDLMIPLSVTMGVVVTPNGDRDGEMMLKLAETALSHAKGIGQGTWVAFSSHMEIEARKRRSIETGLRSSIKSGGTDFWFVYQPKVDLERRLLGFEALIRWKRDGTTVSPSEFIGIAEETGMIRNLGALALEDACKRASDWSRTFPEVKVAVNVSPKQLVDKTFVQDMRSAMYRNQTPPKALTLEITEGTLLFLGQMAIERIGEIRKLGVEVAIDDFGTGYSSLSHLQKLPIDIVKLDRSFVSGLPEDGDVPETVLNLAKRMGIKVIAEGVETERQFQWLAERGCYACQGFLFAPPLDVAHAEEFLKRRATFLPPT
jgi:diguanylate cyclase (GGDEF)-like protein